MIHRKLIRHGTLALVTFATAACATHNSPWTRHDRLADLKSASADPARMCDVIVENATEIHLDAALSLEGREHSLGLLSPGQRAALGVSCHAGRIEAVASSSFGEMGGSGSRFRKVARLDVLEATHLRFTGADRIS